MTPTAFRAGDFLGDHYEAGDEQCHAEAYRYKRIVKRPDRERYRSKSNRKSGVDECVSPTLAGL
jgi:hypothetical protein